MTTKIANEVYSNSEYGTLKQVAVCKPSYMRISTVINETQRHFIKNNIDVSLALQQHTNFINTLKANDVEVIELEAEKRFPEQVFTRDIGFTIDNTVYIAEMGCQIRQGEELVLKKWVEENNIVFHELNDAEIEGGDVIVDRTTVYVGVSDRTSLTSVEKLASQIKGYDVIPIPFQSKYLHLDCVFNIISETEAIIFSPAFMKNEIKLLSKKYDLIEVDDEEQFTMGINILSIGQKKILSLPLNKKVNQELRKRGYTVIETDFSEIIKSGGSFRCCSMPLLRESR